MPLVRHLDALYEGIDETDAIRFFLERARIELRASNVGHVWLGHSGKALARLW